MKQRARSSHPSFAGPLLSNLTWESPKRSKRKGGGRRPVESSGAGARAHAFLSLWKSEESYRRLKATEWLWLCPVWARWKVSALFNVVGDATNITTFLLSHSYSWRSLQVNLGDFWSFNRARERKLCEFEPASPFWENHWFTMLSIILVMAFCGWPATSSSNLLFLSIIVVEKPHWVESYAAV